MLTLTQVEEIVQQKAEAYLSSKLGAPRTAAQIILWPTEKHRWKITGGPTAIVRMGILPGHPDFNKTLTDALHFVVDKKAYQRLEVERVSVLMKREEDRRRILKESYQFDEDLVPLGVKPGDLSVKLMQRVEVVHRPSGIREVVEFEVGKGNTHAATELAKARMGRRLAEAQIAVTEPWDLPQEHPDWVARTN